MPSYDDIVEGLEDGWMAAGLHDHSITESVVPDTHERTYRVELFPEHGDPLTEENMPPWVDVSFAWTAAHQLRAEGREVENEPLALIWNYTVLPRRELRDQNDQELVRKFQVAIQSALRRFYPGEADAMSYVDVEVRRFYQRAHQHARLAYVQLLSMNITDLSEQWDSADAFTLSRFIRTEMQFASAVIQALASAFAADSNGNDNGNASYRTVDTA
jgi:hypothetical protein